MSTNPKTPQDMAVADLLAEVAAGRAFACGPGGPSMYDDVTRAQDEIETGSQVVGADDEWA